MFTQNSLCPEELVLCFSCDLLFSRLRHRYPLPNPVRHDIIYQRNPATENNDINKQFNNLININKNVPGMLSYNLQPNANE